MEAGGFKFYLVPAPNLSQNPDEQYRLTLEKISSNSKEVVHLLSPTLAERIVSFMKKYTDTNKTEGSLMRQFIRLVKLWNKLSVGEDVYISGRSFIFELIAIHVWEKYRSEKLSQLFFHFLNEMESFHSLRVEFHNDSTDVDSNDNRVINLKTSNDDLPIIIDPSNPYNDLGAGIKEKNCIKQFEEAAIDTRNKLWPNIDGEYKYKGDDNMIQEFISSWRSLLLVSNSSLVKNCDWLAMVCKRRSKAPLPAPFLRRQKRSKKPLSSPGLLLLLEQVCYCNPRLANACSKDDMEEAVKAVLKDLTSQLNFQKVPSKCWQLCSSSPTLSRFRKCSAHLIVLSDRGIKATIGYRVAA